MSFLNSHNEVLDRAGGGLNAKISLKKGKKKKSAQHDKEILRFFTYNTEPSTGIYRESPDNGGILSPQRAQSQLKQHGRHLSAVTPSLPPDEVIGRPFLGFGDPGLGSQSPSKSHKNPDVTSSHIRRQSRPGTMVDTTTYYTWSQSPARTSVSTCRVIEGIKTTRKLSNQELAKTYPDKAQANPAANVCSSVAPMNQFQPPNVRRLDISLREICRGDDMIHPICPNDSKLDERNVQNDTTIENTTPYRGQGTSDGKKLAYNVDSTYDKGEAPIHAPLVDSMEELLHKSATLDSSALKETSAINQVSNTDSEGIDSLAASANNLLKQDNTNLTQKSLRKQQSTSAPSPTYGPIAHDPRIAVHHHFSPESRKSYSVGRSFAAMKAPSYSRISQTFPSNQWNLPDSIYQQQIPMTQISRNHLNIDAKSKLHKSRSEVSRPSNRPYGTPISLKTRTPIIDGRSRSPSSQIDIDSSRLHEENPQDAEILIEEVPDESVTGWNPDVNFHAQDGLGYSALDIRGPYQYHQRAHSLDEMQQVADKGTVFSYTQVPTHQLSFQDYSPSSHRYESRPQTIYQDHGAKNMLNEESLYESFTTTHLSNCATSSYISGFLQSTPKLGNRPLTSNYTPVKQKESQEQVDEGMLAGFWRPNKLY